MDQTQEFILRSSMTRSKKEFLDHIKERKIYFPPNLESRLLQWNCYPLINFNLEELEVSFGVFFFQILKLSQNQTVRDAFQEQLKFQLKDLQQENFKNICLWVFQRQSLTPFPQSNEFKRLGDCFKESFIYEKHISDKPPSYYKSQNGTQVSEISEQEVKYRIVLYTHKDEKGETRYIIFSTNNDIRRLFPIQNQIFIPKNNLNQNQQPQPSLNFNSNNQKFVLTIQEQTNIQGELKGTNIQPSNGQPKQSSIKNSPLFPNGVIQQQSQQQQQQQQQQHQQQQFQQYQPQQYQPQQYQPYQYQPYQYQQQQPQQYQYQQPQQQQQFQQQQKLQTNYTNSNTNANILTNSFINFNYINANTNNMNLQQNGNVLFSQMKVIPKLNNGIFASTETILQFQDKLKTPIFHSSSLPCNSSQQNVSEQQETEEIDVLSTQQINQLSQIKKDNEVPIQSRIQTNCQLKRQESEECQICTMNYQQDSNEALKTPCCFRIVHADCYKQSLQQKAIQHMNFDLITCYSCMQSLKGYNEFLKTNISISLYGEIVKRKLLAEIPLKCCKCQLPIKASKEILSKQVKLECLQCNTMLCSLCRQEYHGENQYNQSCPSLLIDIQKAFLNMPILVCPFCLLLQTKDDRCNHVKCFSCQKELCSACSVDRIPILAHGNHYHREGCPDYKQWELNDKVVKKKEFDKKKCQRCQESGKPCEYPMSLQEYKKQIQF